MFGLKALPIYFDIFQEIETSKIEADAAKKEVLEDDKEGKK